MVLKMSAGNCCRRDILLSLCPRLDSSRIGIYVWKIYESEWMLCIHVCVCMHVHTHVHILSVLICMLESICAFPKVDFKISWISMTVSEMENCLLCSFYTGELGFYIMYTCALMFISITVKTKMIHFWK